MGSAVSKVAAQPLAVVSTAGSGTTSNGTSGTPRVRRSGTGWPCGVGKKQNKTAPTAVPSSTPAAVSSTTTTKTPRSTPTMEAIKPSKETTTTTITSITSSGPSAQLLVANKAVSLHQLSFEELSTQLLKAVKNGDQRLVERVVELAGSKSWAITNIRGMWESTPLIYACQYCHEPIALWLLQQGADMNLVNEKGVSALLLASLEGMTKATEQMLLRHASDAAAPPDSSASPRLSIDAQVGVVYNSVADLNVRASPLLAASMNGHEGVVKLLLQHGADVNHGVALLSSGGTKGNASGGAVLQFPLLVAAKYGHSAVVQHLIQHGADIVEMDGNENHALLLACEAAKEDCALALLRLLDESGEDHAAWKRANVHGFTPLHFCAVHGLVAAAEFMLHELRWEQDAAFVNATSSTRQESAVLMAVRKKQLEVVKLLIQSGADAKLADRGATTALDVLKRDKRDELVELWQEIQVKKTEAAVETKIDGDAAMTISSDAPILEGNLSRCDDQSREPEDGSDGLDRTATAKPIIEEAHERENLAGDTRASEELAKGGSDPIQTAPNEGEPDDPFETRDIAHTQPAIEGDTTLAPSEDGIPTNADSPMHLVGVVPSDSIHPVEPTQTDASFSEPIEETEDIALPEGAVRKEEEQHMSDQGKSIPQGVHELEPQEEEVPDFMPMVPRKPLGNRSKSTTGRKTHNRRPTGFVAEPKTKAKSLSSLGALAALPPEGNEDEDADDADNSKINSAESRPRNVEAPNEEGKFGLVGQFDEPVGDEMPTTMATQASASPRKTSDKHKKKKRHSKKKHSDAEPSSAKEMEPTTPEMAMDEGAIGVAASSLCIPESGVSGDLDDDF